MTGTAFNKQQTRHSASPGRRQAVFNLGLILMALIAMITFATIVALDNVGVYLSFTSEAAAAGQG